MITEKSCGAIVFTKENGQIRYVIIQSNEGIYGFPTGHMEGTETEIQTALREIAEETGLTVNIIDGFRTEDIHTFPRDGETRLKHIVYFLGESSNQTPIVQNSELRSIYLLDYETAMSVFQFESSRKLLAEAHRFVMQ